MKIKYWYIWFSYLTFALLWGDTRVKLFVTYIGEVNKINASTRANLWLKANCHFFMLFLFIVIIPFVVLYQLNVFIIDLVSYPALELIMQYIVPIYAYLSGVLISYRHALWREKYLPPK